METPIKMDDLVVSLFLETPVLWIQGISTSKESFMYHFAKISPKFETYTIHGSFFFNRRKVPYINGIIYITNPNQGQTIKLPTNRPNLIHPIFGRLTSIFFIFTLQGGDSGEASSRLLGDPEMLSIPSLKQTAIKPLKMDQNTKKKNKRKGSSSNFHPFSGDMLVFRGVNVWKSQQRHPQKTLDSPILCSWKTK